MGLDTVDLLMTFGIKETECVKDPTKDPQKCAFRPGFFVVRHFKCHQGWKNNLSQILHWSVLVCLVWGHMVDLQE